jgi:hypothetical protein
LAKAQLGAICRKDMYLRLRLSLLHLAFLLSCAIAGGCIIEGIEVNGAEARTADRLPSAKEVLERFSKAIGGKDFFKKVKSQHAAGTVQMKAQGISGKLEVWAERPNKMLMKMSIPGIGDFDSGFDGKVAWMSSALTGPMLLEGKMGEEIAAQADFDHKLYEPGDYTKMEMLGLEEFNGEPCYKLKLMHRTGFESTEFFSQKTGLQRGFIATQESPLGPITSTTSVTDYKKFGEMLMPSRIAQKAAGVETVMTMDEMDFDQVDSTIFVLPGDVRALTETSKESPFATKEVDGKTAGKKIEREALEPKKSAVPVKKEL